MLWGATTSHATVYLRQARRDVAHHAAEPLHVLKRMIPGIENMTVRDSGETLFTYPTFPWFQPFSNILRYATTRATRCLSRT